jgi:hypothetical protein
MSFLLPFFLGAGALIGIPIALHFLRRKPQVLIVFPTLQFLGPTAVLETRNHRLRRWLTLLLRCLIILLIGLAFSRPFWNTDRVTHGRAVVIAVDNSFSMQTKGRWDKLRTWAEGQLSRLGPGDRAGLLLMNPLPRWLVPLTDKTDVVRQTLKDLKPGYETTHYDPALRMAGDALLHSGAPETTLVWMADEQQLGWKGVSFSAPLPDGVKFVVPPPVDPPARQAAIMKTQWAGNASTLVLHVDINQYTPDHDSRQITLSVNGKVVSQQKVALLAGHPNSFDLPFTGLHPIDVTSAKVELDPDDLPADDTFYAVHDKDVSTRISLTPLDGAPDNFDFLRHAIDATKEIAAAPLLAQDLPDAEWPVDSVVVVRGGKPFEQPQVNRLDTFLKAGGVACIFLDGAPAQADWMRQHNLDLAPVSGSPDAPLHLRNWDTRHPLLAPIAEGNLIGLLNIEFYRGLALQGLAATPLATWDNGGAAIADVNTGGLHFLVCGFDLDRSSTNWTVHSSFVPFVHSALLWLSRQQNIGGDWRVGDAVTLPGAGTWKRLDGPGDPAEAQVSDSVRPPAPGLYQFTGNGETRLYAVNLKPEESDPAPWSTPKDFVALSSSTEAHPQIQNATLALSREDAENQQRVWWWLLAFAVVLTLAELRVANRTSI